MPDSDQTKALRVLTRSRQDLVRTRIVLANQLRDQLACFWPGASQGVHLGGLQDRAGVPSALPKPRGRPWPRRATPSPRSLPSTVTQAANQLRSCWASCGLGLKAAPARLRPRHAGRSCSRWSVPWNPSLPGSQELTIEIRHALDAHPDGPIFRSLFIAEDSWLTAATMLAEIGDCRDRYPSYRALAADAGQSPVAHESGKSRRATVPLGLRPPTPRSVQHPRRLKPTPQPLGRRHLQASPRNEAHGHAHAARILGRSWTQIIWRLWQDHDTYDPTQTHRPPEAHRGRRLTQEV